MAVKIKRDDLLRRLTKILPGLSNQGVIEQSSCYVFHKGRIWTFNDDIVGSIQSLPGMEGIECAVPGDELRRLLERLQDQEELELLLKEDDEGSEMVLKAENSRAGIRIEREVYLPVDSIMIPISWRKLPGDFLKAVEMTEGCASRDSSTFALSCLHITGESIEAVDGYHAIRFKLKTDLEKPVLVKRDDLLEVCSQDVLEWAVSDSWLFFRGDEGFVIGCRLWDADFPQISQFFEVKKAQEIVLPEPLEKALERAEVFLNEDGGQRGIIVDLNRARLLLRGEGETGWYEEEIDTNYKGEPVKFRIHSRLLREVYSRTKTKRCLVGENRLLIRTEEFDYVSSVLLAEAEDRD